MTDQPCTVQEQRKRIAAVPVPNANIRLALMLRSSVTNTASLGASTIGRCSHTRRCCQPCCQRRHIVVAPCIRATRADRDGDRQAGRRQAHGEQSPDCLRLDLTSRFT